jgi:hypothetical protein
VAFPPPPVTFPATRLSSFDVSGVALSRLIISRERCFVFIRATRSALRLTSASLSASAPSVPAGFQLPLRRFETSPCCRRVVAAASAASREVQCASEYCELRSARPVGLPDPALALPFPGRLRGVPAAAVPRNLRRGSILSCASFLLRVLRDRPPLASRREAPSLGFCPLRDISHRSPPPRGLPRAGCQLPKLAAFRPRRFARPRRLPPPPALRACFIPLPRPGFSLQGFFPAHGRTSSSLAVALLTFEHAPCPQFYPWAPVARPRLQGFAPYADPSRPEVV